MAASPYRVVRSEGSDTGLREEGSIPPQLGWYGDSSGLTWTAVGVPIKSVASPFFDHRKVRRPD